MSIELLKHSIKLSCSSVTLYAENFMVCSIHHVAEQVIRTVSPLTASTDPLCLKLNTNAPKPNANITSNPAHMHNKTTHVIRLLPAKVIFI